MQRHSNELSSSARYGVFCLLLISCREQEPTAHQKADARQEELRVAAQAEKDAEFARRRQAERRAKQAHAAELQAKARAEQRRKQREACCLSLARRGFEERSEKDMSAKRHCLEALDSDAPLAEQSSALLEVLGGRPLPAECTPLRVDARPPEDESPPSPQ